MKKLRLFGKELFAWGTEQEVRAVVDNPLDKKALPPGRVSVPPFQTQFAGMDGNVQILAPEVFLEVIPYIRKLVHTNPNFSQALNNVLELGNTGHDILFDPSVPAEQQVAMRYHLKEVQKSWVPFLPGSNGLVNRMFSQIMTAGALSIEWVPKMNLTGIKSVFMVAPETIRWGYDKVKQIYVPYQLATGLPLAYTPPTNLIPLNPFTYKYFALNGDTDSPYGIPPYLAALDTVKTQKLMMDNIKFIVESVGIMGFLEVLVEKPEQQGDEAYDKYVKRLEQFLVDTKKRVQEGYRDGISVGFKEDHEFNFHSATKAFSGVNEFFELNELLFASGLKMDASMMGRNYGTTESQISIVFTKLIAQLNNIQQMVASCLEYGYSLELRLAGFSFKSLTVEFKPCTALDELKYQQAREIQVRNNNAMYYDGIISQEQYAHDMGYDKPDQLKPRVERVDIATPGGDTTASKDQKRNKSKKEGAKTKRKKDKPQDTNLK